MKKKQQFKPKHYSTGDWDYSGNNWMLDTSKYVSSPSSFRNHGNHDLHVFVKTSVVPVTSVKEGRIETYYQQTLTGGANRAYFYLHFRFQDWNNRYYMMVTDTLDEIHVCKYKAGAYSLIDKTSISWSTGTWYHIRVTWWNDYVGLAIRVELEQSGNWVTLLDTYDPANDWKDTGGRVGFSFVNPNIHYHYVDDTKIYGVT